MDPQPHSTSRRAPSGGDPAGGGPPAAADRGAGARETEPRRLEGTAEISLDEVLALGARIVDVRAPGEFTDDHIPGAHSVPIFSDRERAVVGTLFRHLGQSEARSWGSAQVRARLGPFLETLREGLDLPPSGGSEKGSDGGGEGCERLLDPPRVICCARGGERSAAVTALLREHGYPVRRLTGGYRTYRTRVRERLHHLPVPGPILLDGLTGCGKTAVLRRVAERRPRQVLDLEGLARHRSSLLGDIGLAPSSQKEFEGMLVAAVDALEGPWTLIEAESRRVGDREIPGDLFQRMCAAPRIELRASVEQRIEILHEDYLGVGAGDGCPEDAIEAVCRRVEALAAYPRVGEGGVRWLQETLRAGQVDEGVRFLLEEHYDPRYRHGQGKQVPLFILDRSRMEGGAPAGDTIEQSACELIAALDQWADAGASAVDPTAATTSESRSPEE